jgi:hypothetical protein
MLRSTGSKELENVRRAIQKFHFTVKTVLLKTVYFLMQSLLLFLNKFATSVPNFWKHFRNSSITANFSVGKLLSSVMLFDIRFLEVNLAYLGTAEGLSWPS